MTTDTKEPDKVAQRPRQSFSEWFEGLPSWAQAWISTTFVVLVGAAASFAIIMVAIALFSANHFLGYTYIVVIMSIALGAFVGFIVALED